MSTLTQKQVDLPKLHQLILQSCFVLDFFPKFQNSLTSDNDQILIARVYVERKEREQVHTLKKPIPSTHSGPSIWRARGTLYMLAGIAIFQDLSIPVK